MRWASPGNFRRAGLTVLVGSAAGFGVTLALTPVVSRLFTPESFGLFSTMVAATSALVGISTFRLEVLAQRTTHDEEAHHLLALALSAALVWGVVGTAVSAAFVLLTDASAWWLLSGLLILVASLQLIGAAALTRQRKYRELALLNFIHGASVGITQVLLGLLSAGVGALLTGFVAARLVWLRASIAKIRGGTHMKELWRRSRRFALMAGASAFVNSCAGQLPILLCAVLFGPAEVGFLAMAVRLLVAPLGVIGQAAAAATIGEVGQLLRHDAATAILVVRSGMRDLFLIGIWPCAAAGIFGLWLVPLILGPQWHASGLIVAVLSAGALAQFVAAPFSQLLNVTGRNRLMLRWDVVRFIVIGITFVATAAMGGTLYPAVAAYSAVSVVLYVVLGKMCLRAVRVQ